MRALLLILYVALDSRRIDAYLDPIALWEDAARHQPDNTTILTNWGVALAAAGRTAEAITHYQTAVRIDPETRRHPEHGRSVLRPGLEIT